MTSLRRVRLPPVGVTDVARPAWLTRGAVRLVALSVFIVAIGMVRPRLTPRSAAVIDVVGGVIAVVVVLAFSVGTRRVARRLPLVGEPRRLAVAVLAQVRRTGLPLLGLAFFLLWTCIYLALWAFHPEEAFRGLSAKPRFADFFYYAVSTAFISPPGDIVAHSRGARSATMIEMLTAFALLTAYLSSFVDWRLSVPEPDAESDQQ